MSTGLSGPDKSKSKVAVVGLGTVGLPTAIHASRFFEVTGFDVDSRAVKRARSRGLRAFNEIEAGFGIWLVIVSTTLLSNGAPDPSPVQEACKHISNMSRNPLVLVESTVPVGTCRDISGKLHLRIAHCPHRYWSGDPRHYGVVQTRVLGAVDETSLGDARRFYNKLKVPLHVVSSAEIAELSKVAENAYRFVQIAFAEDLKMGCDTSGLSFSEVRAACNSKWNINILSAEHGIGGQCLPKDIRYLLSLRGSPLLSGAILTDNEYRKHLNRRTRRRPGMG